MKPGAVGSRRHRTRWRPSSAVGRGRPGPCARTSPGRRPMSPGLGRAGPCREMRSRSCSAGSRSSRRTSGGAHRLGPELEDVHINLEMALAAWSGRSREAPTGRSRNDQVATELRLGCGVARSSSRPPAGPRTGLRGLARREAETMMPGHTHVQPAQPCFRPSPAGLRRDAGAGPWPVRGRAGAQRLAARGGPRGTGYASTGKRSRRTWASTASPATHRRGRRPRLRGGGPPRRRSRWSTRRDWRRSWSGGQPELRVPPTVGRVLHRLLDDAQQAQPGPAELIRGRTAGVIGQLTGALVLLKGLPASYQRDLQEDKPPLFAGSRRSSRACGC